MKDLPQEFFIENSTINVEFLDNRIGEITAGVYRVFVPEIESDCQQIDAGTAGATFQVYLRKPVIYFYLTDIGKIKLEKCQPKCQFCQNLICCSHWKIM